MRSKGFLETWLFPFLVFGEAELFVVDNFCLTVFIFVNQPTNQATQKDQSAVWIFFSMFFDFPLTQQTNQRAVLFVSLEMFIWQ